MGKERTNDQQNQSVQNKDMARNPQQQGGLSRRSGYDPFRSSILPTDFFRMNPFAWMRHMSDEMDRFFNEGSFGRAESAHGHWHPAVEVSVRNGQYVVCADLAGVNPQDLKVESNEDSIVIEGERKSEHEENEGGVHRSEFRYGHFHRSIPLPEGANAQDAKAKFENGVLEITMPMEQQSSKSRQIPIEGASGKPAATTTASRTSSASGHSEAA